MRILVKENISMVRGDTYAFDLVLSELDANVNTIFFTVKKWRDDAQPTVQKSLADGITTVGELRYRIRVAPEDTKELEAGNYIYDLQIGIGEDIYTPMMGEFIIIQDVT